MSVKIHIGQLIQEEVERQNLSIAEFGRRINKTRPSVYHVYKSKSIDSDLLHSISEVLHVDFFQYYPMTFNVRESEIEKKDKEIERLKNELSLRDRLIALLEERSEKN